MKLLVIHDKPRHEMGGMTRFIAAQNALLARAQWQIAEVICTPTPQDDALHVPPSGRRIGLHALRDIRQLLAQQRPDAILVHSVYYAMSPYVLQALAMEIPLVYVLHDVTPLCPHMTRLHRDSGICHRRQGIGCITSGCYRPGQQNGWASDLHGLAMRAWHMRAARSINQWVVPSRYLKELLCAHSIAHDRVAVIPHFSPSNAFQIGTDNSVGTATAQANRLLFAGRLVPEKGIDCLLDALVHLDDVPWTLHIAGEGPQQDHIQHVVHQRNWSHRVRCLGTLTGSELDQQYQQASVVVMPSLIPESFGMVGLEAMCHRRPVVGFASGGMTEWLRHGFNGLVAQWGDAPSLARALRQLLTQPQQAARFGEQGFAMVAHEFSPDNHLRAMQNLLHNVTLS